MEKEEDSSEEEEEAGGGLRWRGADPAAVYGVVSSCSEFVLW